MKFKMRFLLMGFVVTAAFLCCLQAEVHADVTILGSWTSGTSHTAESGTDRALIFTVHVEDNDTNMNASVTYGGQAMTKVIERNYGSRSRVYVAAFVLDEAGINAASGSTFNVSWSQTPSNAPSYSSVFLGGVDQSDAIGASAGNGAKSKTVATTALGTSDGDMVLVAGTCGRDGTYSVNNGFTEAIELTVESADGVAGYKAATGANETPSITHTKLTDHVIIGFVVNAVAAPPDTTPPTPDPMTWASVPAAAGSTSITMTATTASDPSGVEYYFTCTAGGGNNSDWQDSDPTYVDTGLTPETMYTYTVRARDKSVNQNETADSSAESATTEAAGGEAPVYEGFDYTSGAGIDGLNGGIGFSSAWNLYSSNGTTQISSSGLTYAGLPTEGLGLSIIPTTDTPSVLIERNITDTFGDDGTTKWVSFLLKANDIGDGHSFVVLNDGGPLQVGKRWGNMFAIDNNSSSVTMYTGITYFVVARYDFNAGDENAYLWIDPAISAAPDIGSADATKNGSISPGGKITINFQGYGQGDYIIDELRVGDVWNDVRGGGGGGDDYDPPTPDPMTWATVPYATGAGTIRMIASTASDPWGVEYYFECTAGGGPDSGWRGDPDWSATGLEPETPYTYRAKARDLSVNFNETGWSSAEEATTQAEGTINVEETTYSFWCGQNPTGPEAACAWYNDKVCVMIEDEIQSDRDYDAMVDIVNFFTNLHLKFEDVTGNTDLPLASGWNGRIVIQIPLDNCGAGGLANHGSVGISVGVGLFNTQHSHSVAGNNKYLQVWFYETNRNYWLSADGGYNQYFDWAMDDNPDNYGWWTVGMNNAMAYIMPDLLGVHLDYYGQDENDWYNGMVANLTTYINDPQYDFDYGWLQALMPWKPTQSINDLMTGFILQSYTNWGGENWITGFYTYIDSVTPRSDVFAFQECRNNVYTIWSRAANQDLRTYFTNTLKWTITAGDPL